MRLIPQKGFLQSLQQILLLHEQLILTSSVQNIGIVMKGEIIPLIRMGEDMLDGKRTIGCFIAKLDKGIDINCFPISNVKNMIGWMILQDKMHKAA